MTYCREGHTLVDNEAEGDWEQLIAGTFFELVVSAVTYFGIVDEYVSPTTTTLIARLYSDSGHTTLVTTAVPTAVPYTISNFASFTWTKSDLQAKLNGTIGTWISPSIKVRDDTGTWVGNWRAEPKPDTQSSAVEFKFAGVHTLFTASVESFTGVEVTGSGLAAGTYQYCMVPVDTGGLLGAGSRIVTVVLAGTADITLNWAANNQVTSWNIYGRQFGASFGLLTNVTGATITYTDNGVDTTTPALRPPLFEAVGWTAAVANKAIDTTNDGINLTGDIDETAVEVLADGTVITDADGVGTLVADNIPEGLRFDITGLESTTICTENAILDANIFDPASPPTGQTPTVTYDYHVFVATGGLTVIQETDSGSGQTKKITVNTVTGKFDIEVIENAVIIASGSIDIDPTFVIPTAGSMSVTSSITNVSVLADGVIIGDECIEVNTFQVAPVLLPSTLVLLTESGTETDHRIKVSTDSALTWTNNTIIGRIDLPGGGFGLEFIDFFWVHGYGWTVIATVNSANPSLVTDLAFSWTNDAAATTWPFNDDFGIVSRGEISAGDFEFWFDNGSTRGVTVIIKPANGIGVMVYYVTSIGADEIPIGNALRGFAVFFPDTGTFKFIRWDSVSGPLELQSYTVWAEKNLLIGVDSAGANIHIWDISTSQTAPLTNHRQLAALTAAPVFGFFKICNSPTEAFILYVSGSGNDVRLARSSDGLAWTHTLINGTGSFDPTVSGQEILGLLIDHHAYNRDLGKYLFTSNDTIFDSTDTVVWNTTAKTAGVLDQSSFTQFASMAGSDNDSRQPMLWDGTLLSIAGPDNAASTFPGTYQRFNSAFVDASPLTGGGSGGAFSPIQPDGVQGVTVANPALPEGIPQANVRRFIGRVVNVPDVTVDPPIRIRDTTISPVFASRDTRPFQTSTNTIDQAVASTQRGGVNNLVYVRIQNGQKILAAVPGAGQEIVDVVAKWNKPRIGINF